MSEWVDFKELRGRLDFGAVLTHYKIEPNANDGQHISVCPLPSHKGTKTAKSFSANLTKGIFHCFGCSAKGNVLDFAVYMEGGDPKNPKDLRKAALGWQRRLSPPKTETPPKAALNETGENRVLVNAPIDFALKGLEAEHPYLAGRGFNRDTIAHFGLGYCSRGLLKDRIAIPLHNQTGELIGYVGRIIADIVIDADNPKYKFPQRRERRGVALEFDATAFLYNGYRIRNQQVEDLIVVDGFPMVWALWQARYANVVGLMGPACSEVQALLAASLVRPKGRLWLVSAQPKAGERYAEDALKRLAAERFCRWVPYDRGKEATSALRERLEGCLPR